MTGRTRVGLVFLGVLMNLGSYGSISAADDPGASETPPASLVAAMVAKEQQAERHRDRFSYLSEERSERTGGHLWRERVAETPQGKVRFLIAEDGQPLSTERMAQERGRLAQIAAHPEEFVRHEQALKNDEQHAKEMLDLLPKAFVFENPRQGGNLLRIDFKPNPNYAPQSLEERVLHGMVGSVTIETNTRRLRALDGRLPEVVTIGFGLLATIKAGSHFETVRTPVYTSEAFGTEWKTESLDTNITGRAIFFKAIGKKEHAEHSGFTRLSPEITVPEAVAVAEQ